MNQKNLIYLMLILGWPSSAFCADHFESSPPVRDHFLSEGFESGPLTANGYTFWVSQEKGKSVFHVRSSQKLSLGSTQIDPINIDCPLWVMPKQTQLYHWGPKDVVQTLSQAGEISEATLSSDRARMLETKQSYHQGEGLYVSVDPTDSTMYGDHLLVDTLKQDIRLIDPYVCSPTPPWHLLITMLKLEFPSIFYRLGIMGTRHYDPYHWLVLFDGRATQQVREVKPEEFSSEKMLGRRPRDLRELLDVDKSYPLVANPWLRKNYPTIARLVEGEPLGDSDRAYLGHELGCELLNGGTSRSALEVLGKSQTPLARALRENGFLNALKQAEQGSDQAQIPPWLVSTVTQFREYKLHETCVYDGPRWFMDHTPIDAVYVKLPPAP